MKNSNLKIVLLLWGWLLLISHSTFSQGWETTLGGLQDDQAHQVHQLPDGSFMVAGLMGSAGARAGAVAFDLNGDTIFSNSYGNDFFAQYFLDFATHSDNQGFTYVGYTNENDDLYIVKTNPKGHPTQTLTHSNNLDEKAKSIFIDDNDNEWVLGTVAADNVSPRDFLLLKIEETGDPQEWQYGNEADEDGLKILSNGTGNLYLFGSRDTENGLLIICDTNGVLIDTKTYPGFYFADAVATPDGGFMLAGHTFPIGNPSPQVAILKINAMGTEAGFEEFGALGYACAKGIDYTEDGGYILTGSIRATAEQDDDVLLLKVKNDNTIDWYQTFGGQENDIGNSVEQTLDGGYVIAGTTRSLGAGGDDFYLIKTNANGESYTKYLQGQVVYDLDSDCENTSGDIGLQNWLIQATGINTFYTNTAADGSYFMRVDSGAYKMEVLIPNAYWMACTPAITHDFDTSQDTFLFDFSIQAQEICPILQVDIGTPFLCRCFDNTYTVSWCNVGTALAEDATLEVVFDQWLEVTDTEIIPTDFDLSTNTYYFDIGNVGIGDCGAFSIETLLNCDSTILGQTHCVEAHIRPDSICLPPNTQWDGSSIDVDIQCEEDEVQFRILNMGQDMGDSLDYFVTEDHVLLFARKFKLDAAQALDFVQPANGNTWRLEAEQAAFHPSETQLVSASLEGCGLDDTLGFSISFVNQFSDDDEDPFVAEDCRENIGAYDPNDKQAFPKGVLENHKICPNIEIEYLIRFQNTGTDTAFRVAIRDTLSALLDFTTIRPLSASHNYEFKVLTDRVVEFTFDNILLPDSTTNEAASQGFVRFVIQQMPNNSLGSIISNRAGIYFDFNAPIITNEIWHTVDTSFWCPPPVSIYNPINNTENTIELFPNPTTDRLNVQFYLDRKTDVEIVIFNAFGQKVMDTFIAKNIKSGEQIAQISTKKLEKGTYFLVIKTNNGFDSQLFVKI